MCRVIGQTRCKKLTENHNDNKSYIIISIAYLMISNIQIVENKIKYAAFCQPFHNIFIIGWETTQKKFSQKFGEFL